MTARPLISLALITALVLPTSLSAGPEKDNIEAQNAPTTALLQQAIPGRPVLMDAGDAGTYLLQPGGTVPLRKYQDLEYKYRQRGNGALIAIATVLIQTSLFVVSLTAGWIKLYTDCKP